jgi:co-chaperonin GroES (HSP10)
MNIIPINNCLLVELTEAYELVETVDKQYSTKTSGIVIAVDTGVINQEELLGKKVFFKDFEDGTQIDEGDKKYALIKYSEVRGYKEV